MGIPLGYALGFGVGGVLVDADIYTNGTTNESWRAIFFLEAIGVLPLALLLLFCMKSPPNMIVIEAVKKEQQSTNLTASLVIFCFFLCVGIVCVCLGVCVVCVLWSNVKQLRNCVLWYCGIFVGFFIFVLCCFFVLLLPPIQHKACNNSV